MLLFVCGLDFISLISLYLKSGFCFAFNFFFFFHTVPLYVKRMECQYHANKESREQKAGHRKPGSPSYLLCGTMVDHRICQAGRHLRQSPSLPLVPSAVSSEAQLMRTPESSKPAASSIRLLVTETLQELLLVICCIQD